MQGLKGILAATLVFAVTAAPAQQPASVRVSGAVEGFDGQVLAVKSTKLGEVKIALTGDAKVFGVQKATIADVKVGAFIGVSARPQPNGNERAIQVTVLHESQRGLSEGVRPWDREPNATMTNATVAETVAAVDGHVVTVKYKDGEKKIVIPPDAVILAYVVGDKTELKPGAPVAITRAVKKPDGSLETNRVNVGRGGVEPQ
jgi:translation elongation factor EF-1alpha